MHQAAYGDQEYCFDCGSFCGAKSKCDCCKAHKAERDAAELEEQAAADKARSQRGATTATEDEQYEAARADEGDTESAGSDSQ